MITRVRGTEDVLDLTLHSFLLSTFHQHLALYNFHQIETPILEPTELFVRSVGQETDIVTKEMYTFATSSGESICMRPEGTASIIRAYVENGLQISPWKVYLVGPMFRHERPQKGRWRQFTQISVEVINTDNIAHDVQMIKMLDVFFSEKLKLENYVIKLNFLGSKEDRINHRDALRSFLIQQGEGICATCQTRRDKNPLRTFDCKNEACQSLYKKAPQIIDFLSKESAKEWKQLQQMLSLLGVSFEHDPQLVRGLDYYNKTVFEFTSRDLGAQTAFCGGGRYSLGKEVGAKEDLDAVGVGIGFGRILMLLEKNLNKLSIPQKPALHVIIPFTEEQKTLALMIADTLQAHGIACEVIVETASLGNMMKKANKLGSKIALLIGPDEQQQGTVAVKNMLKGETLVVKQVDLIATLKSM